MKIALTHHQEKFYLKNTIICSTANYETIKKFSAQQLFKLIRFKKVKRIRLICDYNVKENVAYAFDHEGLKTTLVLENVAHAVDHEGLKTTLVLSCD